MVRSSKLLLIIFELQKKSLHEHGGSLHGVLRTIEEQDYEEVLQLERTP
jgi:hypothetical protein